MLRTLTKKAEIAAAQTQFKEALFKQLPARDRAYTVGFQGGKFDVQNLHANGVIWCVLDKTSDDSEPRYWNAFGLADKLRIHGSNTIVVEINIPISGESKRVAGLFAKNEQGGIWLLHRGKVGGGKVGVGKEAFLQHSKLPLVSVLDSAGQMEEAIPVSKIESPTLAADVGRFVRAVAAFKVAVANSEISNLSDAELETHAKKGKKKPTKSLVESYAYNRDPLVVAYVKRRAAGHCELCGSKAPFADASGEPFLECHHIQWLADGGADCASNTCALCPNCHRRMHIVNDPNDVDILLKNVAGVL